jgi:hypothetical protein
MRIDLIKDANAPLRAINKMVITVFRQLGYEL